MTRPDHQPERWPSDQQVRALDLGTARADLMEEIMATPTDVRAETRTPRRLPRWGVVVAAAAAMAVVIAVPVWLGSRGSDGDRVGTSPTSPSVVPADTSPRPYAVLDAPGWTVDHVEGEPADGEVRYVDGDQELQINWRAADTYAGYVEDRADIGTAQSVDVLGDASRLWAYSADDHTTIRPVEGRTFLEVRGSGMGEAAYRRLLSQLRGVDADGFGAALPDSVTLPSEVRATVADMLEEVALPPGFDANDVEVPPYQDPYGVGVAVSTAVTCAWIADYWEARAAGDDAAQQAAATAMRGSRDWSWLTAMKATGDWPSSIYEVGQDMAAGKPADGQRQGIECPAA